MSQHNEEVTILINTKLNDNINNNRLIDNNYLNNYEDINNNMIISNNNTMINYLNFNSFEYECLFFYHRQGYLMYNYVTSILLIFIVKPQYIYQFKNLNNPPLIYFNQTLINTNNNNNHNYQLVNIFLYINIFLTFIHLLVSIHLYRHLNYHILN